MRRLAASLMLSLALAGGAAAQGMAPGQRALLLLRVLAYDRNLKARARQEVRVAVVYRPGHAASEGERDALLLSIAEIAGRAVVGGLPVRASALPWEDGPAFRARLERLAPAALYVGPGLDDVAREIARMARDGPALTLCGSRELVLRGIAVGLVDRGERAGLLVDPRAAAAQGADLDSALLSLAERIERAE